MDFRLLGVVEAWSRHERIDLGPPKQRFLLAVLALKINQPISVDRLVDLTWPISPPPTAQHAIHVRISKLRATIAKRNRDGRAIEILTKGSAYVLQADPMCVDAHRFRALVADARAGKNDTDKMSLYRRALELWRGPPLADVASEIADQLCAGLEETRLIALEECLDAELRLGRHRIVIDELTELVAQYPYRQQLLAQLMLALHRSGRGPEALHAYKTARLRMIEELGLEPDMALRRLEHAILLGDPCLDLAGPGPRVPAPRLPAQVEAAIEVDQLTRRFGEVTALDQVSFAVAPGEIVGVLGAPGAGKTTLIRVLGTLLAPTGGSFAIAGVPSHRGAEIRALIGLLPAPADQPGHLTGVETLASCARFSGLGRTEAWRLAGRLLAEVGLVDVAGSRISAYDRELRCRLGLATALVREPSVLLLDEPTSGLNPLAANRLLDLIQQAATWRGATVLFTTWEPAEVAYVRARQLILDRGVAQRCEPRDGVTLARVSSHGCC
ncbi:BTAD domain-containing putative transcriptional regulator [Amycolatopsis balhimycina]|uniref:BTAD domain-containing putative transcriptional regulator n=1 Tax=Amycolatopsis balhimycina TaxID=208443 RepID=UPI0003A82E09|nr:BTAD domain-containing putative transcriptional regulator [Amycolatopsis balhimycina]